MSGQNNGTVRAIQAGDIHYLSVEAPERKVWRVRHRLKDDTRVEELAGPYNWCVQTLDIYPRSVADIPTLLEEVSTMIR